MRVLLNKNYFYKCSEGKGHNIHHKYSVALDIACIKKDEAPSMLKTHEAMIARYLKLRNYYCRTYVISWTIDGRCWKIN